jgi:predicted lipoprotein with Yx(FWY)xxD motif
MTRRETTTRQPKLAATARAGKQHARATGGGWQAVILRLAGAGLLTAAGAIHLDLYLTGYRTIPTIGWLFLLQVVTAFCLALAILAIPGRQAVLAAAAGAGFALATLGGYLLSVWTGLFGFHEVSTAAGTAAGVAEVVAFAALAALALAPVWADGTAKAPAGFPASIPPAVARAATALAAALAAAGLALLLVVVAGVGSPAPAATGTGAGLKATTIGGTTLLANGKGLTLYWFAPDTPATSKCYGSCAAYWPPATGTAAASPGLPGRTATITRTGGARQLTYDGHPLYTYIGDSAPGQANGNNLNLNGGLWHDIPVPR